MIRKTTTRATTLFWCVLASLAVTIGKVDAQQYPARPITIIVSFAAGGFVDSISRMIGQALSQRLGTPVVIENRPGAAGNLAHRYVVNAQPDGYTLLATSSAFAINETLYKNRGYQANELATIAIVATTPEILVANSAGPKSLKEVVEGAKTIPVNFGTAGVGSASYILTEYFFKELAKAQAVHVPFQGGAPMISTLLGNHITLAAAAMAGGIVPHVQSGAFRGLAIATEKRSALVPGVPTYAEQGYPELVAVSWAGLLAPAKTPTAILIKINAAVEEFMRSPDVVSKIGEMGYEPVYGTPAEADAMLRADVRNWAKMIEAIGLRID